MFQVTKFPVEFLTVVTLSQGRDIAQAVSRRLPIEAARVRAPVRSYGICGGHSSTRAGFLRLLQFPLPILIPQTAPHSSSSFGAGTVDLIVAGVPSGLSLTSPQEKLEKTINLREILVTQVHT
jgi:hypothetical protein